MHDWRQNVMMNKRFSWGLFEPPGCQLCSIVSICLLLHCPHWVNDISSFWDIVSINNFPNNPLPILHAGTYGTLFLHISLDHLHMPLYSHSEGGFTHPMPWSASGSHTLIRPQTSYTFANKTPLRFMKLFQLLLIMNTLELLSPLLFPTPVLLISTSQEARSLDPLTYRLSRLSLCHHPPHSKHTSKALTSGNTNYSATPPPIPTHSVYWKHSKPTPRSSLHLTDLSLLLSEPTDGHAHYLMASIVPQTMDPYSAVFHHPSMLKRMGFSPIFDSCIELANSLNPPCPSRTSSTPTPQVW